MPTYLVTGGAGFIGSHLTEALVKRGAKVIVIDNLTSGTKKNLEGIKDNITFIEADIRSKDVVKEAMNGVDIVFHQAALRSVPASVENPQDFIDVNIKGTINLLQQATAARVKKFIFASSSSVYGDTPSLPQKEGQEGKTLSPYALTKLAGEHLMYMWHKLYGLQTLSLRYFNVYGPRQNPNDKNAPVIATFINNILNDKPPTIHGDGEQSRDFTYIANVVHANLLAAKTPNLQGQAINIGQGKTTTINELINHIKTHLKKKTQPQHAPPRPGDMKKTQADLSKAKELIGYEPTMSFKEGLKITINATIEVISHES